MKSLFVKYKSVVVFLLLFTGSYLVLSLLYAGYLTLSENTQYPPDFITNLVAKQSNSLVNGLAYQAKVIPHESQPSLQLFINGNYLGRVVEGCNAVSIIILFLSFVIAFAQGFKKTMLFMLAGIVLIYAINIIRIAILAMALYHYPNEQHILHGVVFPAIIYGMVFLLWLIWVRMLTPKKVQQ